MGWVNLPNLLNSFYSIVKWLFNKESGVTHKRMLQGKKDFFVQMFEPVLSILSANFS